MGIKAVLLLILMSAPPEPAREFRAAWVTPVEGFDWPKATQTAAQQKAAFVEILDDAEAAGLNSIILHVRVSGDALYKSKHSPWSAYLTGKQGKSPGYDPLAFAIVEAHKRGLQLHAWFNPFRANPPSRNGVAASHVIKKHPGWIVKYGRQTWINPGIPAARAAVLESVYEVVEKYDIDGVHIDDYFYPYREDGAGEFDDPISWAKYGKRQGYTNRNDWRRDNVNKFVEALYKGVHARKPWLPVGISPFGIWKSGVPDGVTGLNAYTEIFADSRLWLEKGWLDYIAPQLYWPMNGAQQRFTKLLDWWHTQNPNNRYIWPGLAAFLAHRPDWPTGEIKNQIAFSRAHGSNGQIFFHMGSALARGPFYDDVAVPPAFPWLTSTTPKLTVKRKTTVGDSVDVEFTNLDGNTRWIVVQQKISGAWQTSTHFAAPKLRIAKGQDLHFTPMTRTGVLGTARD